MKEDGTVLRGSHIADLLRDTVYPLKKVDLPGREYVRGVIRKLYITRSLVYMPRLDIYKRKKTRESYVKKGDLNSSLCPKKNEKGATSPKSWIRF